MFYVFARCKSHGNEDDGYSEYRKPFSFSKNWGRRIKVVASDYSLVNFLQNKKVNIIFHEWQINIWQK